MSVAPHAGVIDFGTFTPPTASLDGIQGEVPQPLIGQENYVLTGNGWSSLGALGTITYQGTWDASTNTPTLTSSVGTQGYYYVVSVAGTTDLNGITTWDAGDWAIFNGSTWQKIEGGATGTFTNVITPQVTARTDNLTLSAISTGAVKFSTLGGLQAQVSDITSAVNYFNINGSATTKATQIKTLGSDTNISMAFQPKGTGAIDLAAGSSGVNISNGGTVTAITTATRGSGYTAMPSVALSAPTTAGGVTATATALLNVNTITLVSGGTGYSVNDVLTVSGVTGGTVQVTVNTVTAGVIATFTVTNFGSGTVSAIPANPVSVTGGTGTGATFTVNWNCGNITVGTAGSGYVEQPTVTITGGSVNGTAYASVGSGTIVRGIGSTVSIYSAGGEQARFGDTFVSGTSANYWLFQGRSAGAQPAFGVAGTDTNISAQYNTKGTGSFAFWTNNGAQQQFAIQHTASAVNYVQVTGAATGVQPTITMQGSDANIGVKYRTKGVFNHEFQNGNGNNGLVLNLTSGAVLANYVEIAPKIAGQPPVISTLGTDTNISMAFQPKGTGAIDLAAGSSGVNISNGGTVTAITRTATGSAYTSIPSVAVSAPTTAGGVQATASANMFVFTVTVASGGTGYTVGDVLSLVGGTGAAGQVTVATVSAGVITGITNGPSNGLYSALPTTPATTTGGTGSGATINITGYGVSNFTITNAGSGYIEQPTVTFSGGGGSGAAAYATVGSATTVRTLGNTLSFYTPSGEGFRVQDAGTTSSAYWTAFGTSTTPVLRAVSSVSGSIGTASAVPLQFITNTSTEQMRVSHTASAVNYVQVTGAATTVAPVISAQGSDTNINLGVSPKGTGVINLNAATRLSFGSANYFQASGASAGSAPSFAVLGSDTNINLALTPKGTGTVQFGTYTAGVLSATGYITITDSGGTTRRLLVG
jgi:hypothetical protein